MHGILGRYLLLFLLLLPGLSWAANPAYALPQASHGVIDLRGVDFARTGPIPLTGDWGIVRGADSSRAFAWTVDAYVPQPGPWNSVTPGIGNATLVLRVLLPENVPPLALAIPDINSAWRLHIDGVLVRSLGQLGLDEVSEVPVQERLLVPLPLGRPFVDLVFEISNHHHFEGGITRAIRLGQAEVLAIEMERLGVLSLAALGALIMVSLVALAFHVGGKRDPAFLVFALFTALVAARAFSSAQLYVLLGQQMRADHWYLPLGYLTLFVFPGLFFCFLREVLPAEIPRPLAWAGFAVSVLMTLVVLVSQPAFFTALRDLFLALNVAAVTLGTALAGLALLRRREGAGWLMAGSGLLLAALIYDGVHHLRLDSVADLVPLGFAAFTTCYFAALALRMFLAERSALDRLTALNRDLEGVVAARTASLAEALAVAERASKAKSEFLAVMSHEIRTPLHGWAGLTELLSQTDLDEVQRRYVRLLRRTAEQLARLVGNILDLAGMESGRVEIAPRPVRLDELAEEMVALVRGHAGDRGQGFSQDIVPDSGGVMLDESAVLQILRTLLDRFGTGSGNLHLSMQADGDRLDIGLRGPSRQDVESSGDSDIGQSLCRNLLEAMNGSLSLRSQNGDVVALLRLPLVVAQAPDPKRQDRPRHVRVLLADDVELNRLVLRGFLTGIGWVVDEAADGRQALEKAKAGGYDLIVLDLRMPIMDGFAAARGIRRHEAESGAAAIPLVALSAGAAAADRNQATQAGFSLFLAKPIGPDALVSALSALLPETGLPPPPSPPAGLEGLMPNFLAEMDKDAARLLALQGGDRDEFAEHVHAMRGKCGMFGENVLFDLLTKLESAAPAARQQEICDQVGQAVERVRQLRQYR